MALSGGLGGREGMEGGSWVVKMITSHDRQGIDKHDAMVDVEPRGSVARRPAAASNAARSGQAHCSSRVRTQRCLVTDGRRLAAPPRRRCCAGALCRISSGAERQSRRGGSHAEVGIDITDQTPKLLEYETAESSDVIVTMGCGDACPIFPCNPVFLGKRYEDWKHDDPAGQGVDAVRPTRGEIKKRIEGLLADLVPSA
jgi:protein-tyrosine-phosphatase